MFLLIGEGSGPFLSNLEVTISITRSRPQIVVRFHYVRGFKTRDAKTCETNMYKNKIIWQCKISCDWCLAKKYSEHKLDGLRNVVTEPWMQYISGTLFWGLIKPYPDRLHMLMKIANLGNYSLRMPFSTVIAQITEISPCLAINFQHVTHK